MRSTACCARSARPKSRRIRPSWKSCSTPRPSKLKTMIAERDALKTDDPEIIRLTDAADRAIREGAIVTARKFLDDAVKRVEATSGTVDAAEELVKQKRLADAAIYVRRADAVVARLRLPGGRRRLRQGLRARREMGRQAQVELQESRGRGAQRAWRSDRQPRRAEARHRRLSARSSTSFPATRRTRDWAITRNNMAVVLQTLGEREIGHQEPGPRRWQIFRDSLAIFEREKDDLNWAAAQNNIGNVLLALGQRESGSKLLEEAVAAFRAALDKRDRAKVPLDWAATPEQYRHRALFAVGTRSRRAASGRGRGRLSRRRSRNTRAPRRRCNGRWSRTISATR